MENNMNITKATSGAPLVKGQHVRVEGGIALPADEADATGVCTVDCTCNAEIEVEIVKKA